MTSKAERRSLTTKRRVSPRSKTSRTLPLRSFLIPGRSMEESDAVWRVAVCISQRSTLSAQHSTPKVFASRRPIGVFIERWTLRVERRTFLPLMAGIVVRPRARILHGHDWVFSSEVLKIFGDPGDGDVISIKDGHDKMLGSAIWNPKSQIVARRFSHRRQDLDLDFFRRRIRQAAEYRARRQVNPRLHRVVWSESDGLPGVILD